MQIHPACPVCESTKWKKIGSRTYQMVSTKQRVSPYVSKRLEVLFRVWHPGASEVTLTSVLCENCGFICYTPRPEEDDISQKYAFLASDETTQDEISQGLSSDQQRSYDLYKYMRTHLRPRISVLDFGGGTGRLMRHFMTHGHDCSLIDYPGKKLPGVHYLGSHLSDIEEGRKFDLIICSHVLEHLANPCEIAHALHSYLTPDGLFYVEVPLEIWKKSPLPVEPVTHINYFTVDSLRVMLERAGFTVMSCKEGLYTTENAKQGLAIRAVAQPATEKTVVRVHKNAVSATQHLLEPGIFRQVMRALKYPDLARREAARALDQRLSAVPFLWRFLPSRPRP